jgi:DNA-binding transcriptional ArsR family regulator
VLFRSSITGQGYTVLIVHHDNAAGKGRGPRAFFAGVDYIWHLSKAGGSRTARCLSFEGRYEELPPEDLVYEKTEDGIALMPAFLDVADTLSRAPYFSHGDAGPNLVPEAPPPPVELDGLCEKTLRYLGVAEEANTDDIASALQVSKPTAGLHLGHLREAKLVEYEERSTRGRPVRMYRLKRAVEVADAG